MVLVWMAQGQSPWGPPHMMAAMVLGKEVLPPPGTWAPLDLKIMMTAMMIHFPVSIVYGLIGAWLVINTLTDRGPLVTITFRTAEGIEIGKTRVKYKSLDIGLVESVRFSSDFSRVEVRARLSKDAGHFLRRDIFAPRGLPEPDARRAFLAAVGVGA